MDRDVDFLSPALGVLVDEIIEAEVSAPDRCRVRRTDSGPYNAPQRLPDTRLGYSFGTIDLHIPKIREGRYSPALLEPRHRSERAQPFVVQQAFVEGVSTLRVYDLRNALGCDSLSKSQGSRICQELEEVVEGFLVRSLDGVV